MSPKQQLLANPEAVKRHADLVARLDVHQFLDIAMLEYTNTQADRAEHKPDAAAYRIQGAREFILIFLALSKQNTTTTRTDNLNLPKE